MENVLDKVRKLLRLSTSSNANEAAVAAAKAQELIDRHHLQADMIALEASEPVSGLDDEPIVNFNDSPLDTPRQLDRWRGALAIAIGRHNACKIWASGATLHLVGRPSDAETVRYLYGWLSREVERLATEQGHGKGRTWRNNFRLGVVDAISGKLAQQRRAFEEEARREAAAKDSTALVRVDQALDRHHERALSVARWVKENMKLYSRGGGASAYDHGARTAGRKAGEAIAIGAARRGLASAARKLPA